LPTICFAVVFLQVADQDRTTFKIEVFLILSRERSRH